MNVVSGSGQDGMLVGGNIVSGPGGDMAGQVTGGNGVAQPRTGYPAEI